MNWDEIRNGNDGWELVEYARQMPSGRDPDVVERFVYEAPGLDENQPIRVVGFRVEGTQNIIFEGVFS